MSVSCCEVKLIPVGVIVDELRLTLEIVDESAVNDPASLSFEPSTIDPASPFTINVPPVPVPIKENFKSKSRTYTYN